jgi:hypothetical protein
MPKYQKAKPFDIVRTIKDMQTSVKQLQVRSTGPSPMPNPLVTLASGFTGYAMLTNMDVAAHTNANNGTQPISEVWNIPANDASVSTEYAIEVPFSGVFENQTLTFEAEVDGTGVAPNGIGASFFSSGQAFNGAIRVRIVIETTGAGGSATVVTDGEIGIASSRSSGVNNNNGVLGATSSPITFDTTSSHTLQVVTVWGGSTASQTITGVWNKYIRSGP